MFGAGTFRLKGSFLLSKAKERGIENRHQLSMAAGLSHQTIYAIFDDDPVKLMSMPGLTKLLINGAGYTPDELANVKFGDIFEYVPENKMGTAD